MRQEDTPGAAMHDADAELRRQAARAMGQARTEKKIAAARAVAESRIGAKWTEEQKANLREKQTERRERERQERAALGLTPAVPVEKKPPGRPRKEQPVDPAPKRPRGRPKKTDGQIPS